MIKTLRQAVLQEKERFRIPRSVQHLIPAERIWPDGIFLCGRKYTMMYRFTDINYAVAGKEDKKSMFFAWSDILNSLDCGAAAKLTVFNRRINHKEFAKRILLPMRGDALDGYREEMNQILSDKVRGANGVVQEKYITISVCRKDIQEARNYFARTGTDLAGRFAQLGSQCLPLDAAERLRILYDFYRAGEKEDFSFDMRTAMKRGQSFKDCICPESFEHGSDYFKLGARYGRVLFLRDYANYIKDELMNKLSEVSRNLMMSMDIISVPTDEAVKEVENRLLGVETNITNWQRRQNASNNFSAIIPYDMELQRKESKDFLNDLTVRDQRMFFGVLTLVLTADTREELERDTESILALGRTNMCQFAILREQQIEGLNTVLPYGIRKIHALRTLNTESLAVFMPFNTQEIMQERGLYCGVNPMSHNLILLDRGKLMNPSCFILGVPGSGKSFRAKLFIILVVLATTKDQILIYDPEGENEALVEALGGVSLPIAAGSSVNLNAMDMVAGYGEKNPVIDKSQFILSLYERISKGEHVGPREKSILDRCVEQVYKQKEKYGILPSLPELRKILLQQPEQQARDLALMLELFTEGSLNIFSQPTNINLKNRIISFNTRDMGEELKELGQLVITDHMINRVTVNWEQGIRTHIFLDEFHTLLQQEYSANFFDSAYRRFRKRDAWLTSMTQNVEYILDSVKTRTMLSNSEFIVMFNQSEPDRKELAKLLHISEQQLAFVTNAQAGNGLLRVGHSLIPFVSDFPKDSSLYGLMSTSPRED